MKMSLNTMALLIVLAALNLAAFMYAHRGDKLEKILFLALPMVNVLLVVAARQLWRWMPFLATGGAMLAAYANLCVRDAEWVFSRLVYAMEWAGVPEAQFAMEKFLSTLGFPGGPSLPVSVILVLLVAVVVSGLLLSPAVLVQVIYGVDGWRMGRRSHATTEAPGE